jgi:hypothetical protein
MLTIRSRGPFRPTALAAILAALVAVLLGAALAAPATAAVPTWAPASNATIHPGVLTYTNVAQCTSNFVFTDGVDVYLGQAAHCSSTSGNTMTDGCRAQSLPLGTPVRIAGASQPGRMVYNSWLTMQAARETDPDICAFNDLALVKIDPADVGNVNPSIPFWGGPVDLNTTGTVAGETVLSYGNSEQPGGPKKLDAKQGVSLAEEGGGWSHKVAMVTPDISGDSGSAFLDTRGNALGVLATLELSPRPGSNGAGDLSRELVYLRGHSAFGAARVVLGTEPFLGPAAATPQLSLTAGPCDMRKPALPRGHRHPACGRRS